MKEEEIYLELDRILSQADHKGYKQPMYLFSIKRMARLINLVNKAYESGHKLEIY